MFSYPLPKSRSVLSLAILTLAFGIGAFLFLTSSNELRADSRPNIVVIITDDQPPGVLGIEGNSVAKTPNIDSIGDNGILFNKLYLAIGICGPSRASILTGKMPYNHGLIVNPNRAEPELHLSPDQKTVTEVLRDNGYYTGMVGKCHLNPFYEPGKYSRGFDYSVTLNGGQFLNWYKYDVYRNGEKTEIQTQYLTDFLGDEAVKFINDASSKSEPFFLWLATAAPHFPTTPPTGQDRHKPEDMPLPKSMSDDLSTKTPYLKNTALHQEYLDLLESSGTRGLQEKIEDLYEVMSNVDDNVGKVLKAIDERGIRDNTIIVFLSDNGAYFGEHQLLRKGPMVYNEQIRTPLIISYPKITSGKNESDALVSSIDIMPTLLEAAGLRAPDDIDGKSFWPVVKGEKSSHRSSVYTYYMDPKRRFTIRVINNGGMKLIHSDLTDLASAYDDKFFELYDLKNDPEEINNLLAREDTEDSPLTRGIKTPPHGRALEGLRRAMAQWQTATNDPRRIELNSLEIETGLGSVTLKWGTSMPATTEIEYRKSGCINCTWELSNDFKMATDHNVTIDGLEKGRRYDFNVYSITEAGDGGHKSIRGVRTRLADDPTRIIGRIVNDENENGRYDIGEKFIKSPLAPLVCSNEFLVNASSSQSIDPDFCNFGGPYYSTGNISPGRYKLLLILPENWKSTSRSSYDIEIVNGQTIHKWFMVRQLP